MLKITNILQYIAKKEQKENRPISKKEIVERFENFYYHNASKHIGDVLSRAVKSNKLIRTERGFYKINPNRHLQKTPDYPNQQTLFK